MTLIDAPDAHMISFVMAIAESSTLEDLSVNCYRAAAELIHAPVLGLYLIRDCTPHLLYSHNAPRGFLNEYHRELAQHDPMIEMIMERRRAAAGSTLFPSRRWNVQIMGDLLRRWGFRDNMCGPVFVGSQLAGLIYIADVAETMPDPERTQRLDFICRSASIALRQIATMPGTGDDNADQSIFDDGKNALGDLPPRLSQVAALVCQGRTNKEIARNMAISHHTVKEHVAALCARFSVQNRTELATAMLRRSERKAKDLPGRIANPYRSFQSPEAGPEYF
nr:helix-turn-helix transcriptional regulator [Mesorhizobium loti]